jgi:hypothetical protein
MGAVACEGSPPATITVAGAGRMPLAFSRTATPERLGAVLAAMWGPR